jgi:hypothetical protein
LYKSGSERGDMILSSLIGFFAVAAGDGSGSEPGGGGGSGLFMGEVGDDFGEGSGRLGDGYGTSLAKSILRKPDKSNFSGIDLHLDPRSRNACSIPKIDHFFAGLLASPRKGWIFL